MNLKFNSFNIHINHLATTCYDYHHLQIAIHKNNYNCLWFSLGFDMAFASFDCDCTLTFIPRVNATLGIEGKLW
jgi:hypothetical protein